MDQEEGLITTISAYNQVRTTNHSQTFEKKQVALVAKLAEMPVVLFIQFNSKKSPLFFIHNFDMLGITLVNSYLNSNGLVQGPAQQFVSPSSPTCRVLLFWKMACRRVMNLSPMSIFTSTHEY